LINRRAFAQSLAAAAVGVATPASLTAQSTAAPDLPFSLSVMLWTVYRDLPFDRRLEKVAEAGYHAVELVDEFDKWTDADFQRFNAKKRSLGITFDATAAIKLGVADPAARDAYLAYIKDFLTTADKLECPGIIVLSGNTRDDLSRQAQHDACIETLRRAGDFAAQRGVTLLLENIDPEENPKYFLATVAEGFEIIRRVDNPHVKFLYDFYHEQIAAGNLIEKLEKNIDLVGLVHIADVPGRHQPGTGEINYASIYRKLADLQYKGYAAMEFEPVGDPVAALRAAREMVTQTISRPDVKR
jgi:hydroxypyruvate isomerase